MSTIKSSSEDLTLNADGSNDIKFQSNGVEKASISSAGAFTSTTIDATKLTGEKRNYIIDGDMTQSPEGDITGVTNGSYGGVALWENAISGSPGVFDSKRTADAPTVGESNHSSTYCLHIDCTTAESAVTAAEVYAIEYRVTGSDFAALDQQEVTLSFWHKHTKTGTYCVCLKNSAADRSYLFEYTQTTTNTWEQHTETVTLDSSGTWLLTEADVGLNISFAVFMGTNYHGTADTWQAGNKLATSNQVNAGDSTSNDMKFAQVGLYLGSTAPTFSSESVATVKSQVDYYVQRFDYDVTSSIPVAIGGCNATSSMRTTLYFRKEMRGTPTVTSSAASTFAGSDYLATATGSSVATTNEDRHHVELALSQAGTTWTTGMAGMIQRDGTDTCWVMADARH